MSCAFCWGSRESHGPVGPSFVLNLVPQPCPGVVFRQGRLAACWGGCLGQRAVGPAWLRGALGLVAEPDGPILPWGVHGSEQTRVGTSQLQSATPVAARRCPLHPSAFSSVAH